jgi:hypothetical protein
MFGLDHLGIAKYGKLAAAEHPDGWALGAFSNVFGDALPAVKAVLDSGRCPRVRLHLYWSDNAGHKPDRDYLRRIEKEAIRVGRFLSAYVGKVDCRVSGFCEHPLKRADAEKVKAVVMRRMPAGVTYVNSFDANLGGQAIPGAVNEVHRKGGRPQNGRYDFSYDGVSATDSDVTSDKRTFGSAETFYFWIPQFNGRLKAGDTTPRPQRKAWPTSNHIDLCIYQSRDLSGARIPNGHILKAMSDQHKSPPEGKDCKPVYITDTKTKPRKIIFKARNGQVIATSSGPASYNEKPSGKLLGWRYYLPDWGHILAEKARRIQGDPLCEVFADGKRIGRAIPAGRAGTFR